MMLTSFCLTLLTVAASLAITDEGPVSQNPADVPSAANAIIPAETNAASAVGDKIAAEDTASTNDKTSNIPQATDAVAAPEAQTWLFRYKFNEGQKLRYQTTQDMTLKATRGEARRIDLSELKQRRLFTVLSIEENGTARIAMQFESVWMRSKIDDNEAVEFNSSMKPAAVPAAFRQVAHELKGSAPRYWLSTTGISMYPVAKNSQDSNPPTKVDQASETVINLVEGETPDNKIQLVAKSDHAQTQQEQKNLADPGSFLMTLPDGEIKVGDTWKETINIPVRLQTEVNIQVPILRTFRLESVENGIAKITFRCSAQSQVRNATVASQLIQATPRGTITFDIDRGLMLRREMRYDESVFGALGAESLLTSVGKNIEEYIEADEAKSIN